MKKKRHEWENIYGWHGTRTHCGIAARRCIHCGWIIHILTPQQRAAVQLRQTMDSIPMIKWDCD